MSQLSTDFIWETFDGLFKTLHRQGRLVEELETRIAELERRLEERASGAATPSSWSRRTLRSSAPASSPDPV